MRTITRTLQGAVAAVALVTTAVFAAPPSMARAEWDTTPVHVAHHPPGTPKTVDLRVGRHPTYDRVVIDLTGAVPGYDVRSVSSLHYDPSGESVPLRGAHFMQVTLTPSAAHDSQGGSLYVGPLLAQYAMPALRGVAFIGDFEGVVTFGLSLSGVRAFRVFELHAPTRIVIDLHH